MFKVQKRDGQLEDFDRTKVIMGAIKAGATDAEAQKLAQQVEASLSGLSVNGVVKSQDLKSRSEQLLKSINSTVAQSFQYYHKPS